jgi:hypothetical protein
LKTRCALRATQNQSHTSASHGRHQSPTVDEYLAELPPERRAVVSGVREMIRRHIPKGYQEMMSFGMIGYGIPLSRYPDTYNKQPLGYVALAAQKNGYSLYLTRTTSSR